MGVVTVKVGWPVWNYHSNTVQNDGSSGLSGCSVGGETFGIWDMLCREESLRLVNGLGEWEWVMNEKNQEKIHVELCIFLGTLNQRMSLSFSLNQ